LRYGELSDGCVCQADAMLPGCPFVSIDDMDHFGPAWRSFPATDRYDPSRLWLCCVSMALCDAVVTETTPLEDTTCPKDATTNGFKPGDT
jgi:hypothetical protein